MKQKINKQVETLHATSLPILIVAFDWNRMVGDSPVWEIVVGVAIVVLFFAVSMGYHSRKSKDDADRRLYPRLCEVAKASKEQIIWWVDNLPRARSHRELDIIELIIARYLELQAPSGSPNGGGKEQIQMNEEAASEAVRKLSARIEVENMLEEPLFDTYGC